MKNVVIIPNMTKEKAIDVALLLAEKLSVMGLSLFSSEKYKSVFGDKVEYYEKFPSSADLIIVVGGDGSVLDASVIAIAEDVPIVGVNLGKVGYLSEVEPDNLDIFSRLLNGDYSINQRMLLTISHESGDNTTKATRLAVNDIVISHDSFLGIADFKVENSSNEGVKYRADGIIISTPSGSTAYSLSAGGPIIDPKLSCFCVTPICPHSMCARPLVFPDTAVLEVRNICTREKVLHLTVDGRATFDLFLGDTVVVTKSEMTAKLLRVKGEDFYSKIRQRKFI